LKIVAIEDSTDTQDDNDELEEAELTIELQACTVNSFGSQSNPLPAGDSVARDVSTVPKETSSW